MAKSINKVILVGNVGGDPEVKTTSIGKKVANVSLATSYRWKGQDGQWQERTQWHRLSAWSPLAEIIQQHVKKGDRLYVEGSIEYRSWEVNGEKRYATDISVKELVLLGGSGRAAVAADPPAGAARSAGENADPDTFTEVPSALRGGDGDY